MANNPMASRAKHLAASFSVLCAVLAVAGALSLTSALSPASGPAQAASGTSSYNAPKEPASRQGAVEQPATEDPDRAAASSAPASSSSTPASEAPNPKPSSSHSPSSSTAATVPSSNEADAPSHHQERQASIDPAELGADIMGPGFATAQQMAELFEANGGIYPDIYAEAGAPTIQDFCELCIEEAESEGVRPEVLFAQAMHETGWLRFGGQVSPEQRNFGGLGALTSGGSGETFPDVRTGLRAQVQHLKAYASTDELANEVVDPRFDLVARGVAPTVYDLNGRWAWPGDGYGEAIMSLVEALY